MPKGKHYSEAPQGVIQTAARLRFAGMSYEKIAERLRADFPQCAAMRTETVRQWARKSIGPKMWGSRLTWDEIAGIIAEVRAEERAQTGTPENADRLLGVVKLIQRLEATLNVGIAGAVPFDADEMKLLKIRPDTWYSKLLAEERILTRGELNRIPSMALRRLAGIIVNEISKALVRRNMVSGTRLKEASDGIITEIETALPHLLKKRIANEVIET